MSSLKNYCWQDRLLRFDKQLMCLLSANSKGPCADFAPLIHFSRFIFPSPSFEEGFIYLFTAGTILLLEAEAGLNYLCVLRRQRTNWRIKNMASEGMYFVAWSGKQCYQVESREYRLNSHMHIMPFETTLHLNWKCSPVAFIPSIWMWFNCSTIHPALGFHIEACTLFPPAYL